MECFELKDPQNLIIYCRLAEFEDVLKNRVFKCFYELYFRDFCNIFHEQCIQNSTIYTVDDQLTTAFDFGVCKFYDTIKLNGWKERGATVKNAVLTFCMFQLLALTKVLRKFKDNPSKFDPSELINLIAGSYLSVEWELEQNKLKEAFEKLDHKCKDFIRWRKLKEISVEEMKARYPEVDFDSEEPTHITYRCMKKLKE